MMLLNDTYIKTIGARVFEPFTTENVQPASYDLRIGETVTIEPAEFRLTYTLEKVKLPKNMAAIVFGKSSYRRLGLSICDDAGFIDPGFHGQITLELKHDGTTPITLVKGETICQIILVKLTFPCERPYNGHYQGQMGVTRSYLEENKCYLPHKTETVRCTTENHSEPILRQYSDNCIHKETKNCRGE